MSSWTRVDAEMVAEAAELEKRLLAPVIRRGTGKDTRYTPIGVAELGKLQHQLDLIGTVASALACLAVVDFPGDRFGISQSRAEEVMERVLYMVRTTAPEPRGSGDV